MKYLKYFLLVILQFAIVELVVWFHTTGLGWHISELTPSDAISLWGTVTTIVFLVFSVLALWNVDQKIQELNEMKRSIGDKFDSIETKNREVMLEADKAQGGNNPDVVKVALDCEAFGAEGITVHPRPDERHIRRSDVYELRPLLTTEFNIEGYPSPEFVDLVLKVKPHQVTLVPDAPDQITSNAGWDTKTNLSFLTELMDTFGQAGIRTSIFVGTDKEMIEYAAKAGADRVELYTEPYATMYPRNPEAAIAPFIEAAKVTRSLGMGLNAGHDLSLVNLKYMHTHIPWLDEVSIGHALISDALYMGLKQTIEEYKNCLRS